MAAKRSRDGESGGRPTLVSSFEEAASRDAESASRQLREQAVLRLTQEGPANPDTKDFCGAFAALNLDNSWDMGLFKRDFAIEVTHLSDELVTFDMKGADPAVANAFRRILLSEVPTVAIGRVTVYQNTGVVEDENVAHRLGLVPIVFEPDDLEWRPADGDFTEDNSIAFTLQKSCRGPTRTPVYSGDLVWTPLSDAQAERWKDNPPRPVADNILIAKLASGQELEVECLAEKGIGRSHAKWSPVATTNYRLLPHIVLNKDILGDDAEQLKRTCPMGVFDIEEIPGVGKRATVAHPRKCTTCRECITSFDAEAHGLLLGKLKNHFLFSIEAAGQVPATKLFERAIAMLRQKCRTAKTILEGRQS